MRIGAGAAGLVFFGAHGVVFGWTEPEATVIVASGRSPVVLEGLANALAQLRSSKGLREKAIELFRCRLVADVVAVARYQEHPELRVALAK